MISGFSLFIKKRKRRRKVQFNRSNWSKLIKHASMWPMSNHRWWVPSRSSIRDLEKQNRTFSTKFIEILLPFKVIRRCGSVASRICSVLVMYKVFWCCSVFAMITGATKRLKRKSNEIFLLKTKRRTDFRWERREDFEILPFRSTLIFEECSNKRDNRFFSL